MTILSGINGAIIGFVAGCVIWNYFSPTLKSWLHMGESSLGTWIKSKIGRGA